MNGMLTRREGMLAGACLLLFAAVAVLWQAPSLERKLNESAAALVAALDQTAGGSRFDRISVRFDGRHALVSGAVRHEQDGRRLITALSDELRTQGNAANPVSRVTAVELGILPLPAGWLTAAVRGFDVEFIGICATTREREALENSLRARWPSWRGNVSFALQVDPRRFDEAASWLATVRALPAPEARGTKSARLLAAQLGGPWVDLPLGGKLPATAPPAALLALGITSQEWQERLTPRHEQVRAHFLQEAAWQAEQERLAKLPPAHVFLGRRENLVLLRGEVFDIEAKRAVIAAVIAALPGTRLLDDLRANGERRPGPGLGALDAAQILSGKQGKSFALGLPGKVWSMLDWEIGREAQPWSALLPPGLEPAALLTDSAVVIDWLQGSNAGIPALPAPPQPAFLTLAVFDKQVLISGRLAEEALRAQVLAAVKRAYPSGFTLTDQITISGLTTASESVQHTTQSIPVPGQAPLLFAVARPGQAWTVLTAEAVAALSSQPETETVLGLPPQTVALAFTNAVEEIQALGLSFPEPPTRAKEVPDEKP